MDEDSGKEGIPRDDPIPSKIGRYRIIEVLGRGGLGTSYLAMDDLMGQKRVVKVASPGTPNAEKRLVDEARLSSQLIQENIPQVYDFGTLENGQSFIVKEWIDGLDLKSILKDKIRLAPGEIFQVLGALAEALAFVHGKGMIHRDIKPANILIPKGEDGLCYAKAKLTDFSLVGELKADTHLTQAGEIFGTPYYMSPEQIRGAPQSPASDIYSLGIVAFELAYGKVPFRQKHLAAVFSEIIEGRLVIPDDPDVPPGLRSLIEKCVRPDPGQRIASGSELVGVLKERGPAMAPLDSVPVRPVPSEPLVTASPKKKSSQGLILLFSSIGLLAILAWSWIRMGRPGANIALLTGSLGLIVLSIVIGVNLGKLLGRAKPKAQKRAEFLLTGTSDRETLTKSIAIEIDSIFDHLKRFDEKVLAESLVLMVREYDASKASDDRQRALMNAVAILDKLTQRLSPWYVRHEKALAFAVSSVGIISGLSTAAATLIKMLSN